MTKDIITVLHQLKKSVFRGCESHRLARIRKPKPSVDRTSSLRQHAGTFVLLLLFGQAMAADSLPEMTIGILTDGPSAVIERLQTQFTEELAALTGKEFILRIGATKSLNGEWSMEKLQQAHQQLQADPEVDMILALGIAAGQVALHSRSLRKPTFAPLVLNTDLSALPRTGNSSGVKNLNYLTNDVQFVKELDEFLELVRFKKLVLLMDDLHYQIMQPELQQAAQSALLRNIQLIIITQTAVAEDLAAKLPPDTDAVMLAPLPRLNETARQTLVDALLQRRLPSYSWIGDTAVEQGVLVGTRPASNMQRLLRRMALNMRSAMLGISTGNLPVVFETKRQLTINMATARRIGVSPRFDILDEAVLLHDEVEANAPVLSLADAAREAINANLDIIAGHLGVEAGAENIVLARSVLFPQITGSVSYDQQNKDNPFVSSGFTAQTGTNGALNMQQVLFSESSLANVEIQQRLQTARKAQQRTLELDIVQQSSRAFLNVLINQTQLKVQQDNLKLTRAHMELAQQRVRVGSSDRSDVFRWESQLATVRQNVLTANARVEQARDQLNRLLHRPLNQRILTQPASLNDPSLLISRQALLHIIDNPHAFELLGEFLVEEGMAQAPELDQLNAQISAQARQLKSAQRAYYVPEVALVGHLSRVFDESRTSGSLIDLEDQNNWQLGIQLSLPLYEGGARGAKTSQSRLTKQQLEVTREAVQERIGQAIKANVHAIRASYPSIELSRQAADTAQKNLDLVRDNYLNGRRSITDLLDAQNAKLTADQSAANAVFNFLVDLMNLQRARGAFDFFIDEPGLGERLRRIEAYIASDGAATRQ